jgi:hypothetical protein
MSAIFIQKPETLSTNFENKRLNPKVAKRKAML